MSPIASGERVRLPRREAGRCGRRLAYAAVAAAEDRGARRLAAFLPTAVRATLDAPGEKSQKDIWNAWRQAAGKQLSDNTRSLHMQADTLVVHVSSPVWAHAVHHQEASILRALQRLGQPHLKHVRIRVTPDNPPPAAAARPRPTLSARTAALLRATAGGVDDPQLKRSLEKLSRYGSDSEI